MEGRAIRARFETQIKYRERYITTDLNFSMSPVNRPNTTENWPKLVKHVIKRETEWVVEAKARVLGSVTLEIDELV